MTAKEKTKRVYALGASLGIVESGNKNDNLHALVFSLTGRESVSQLSEDEFKTVEKELLTRMRYDHMQEPIKARPKPKKTADSQPGMMNNQQQSLSWRLIYRLIELDNGSKADAGTRMCGAIRKILQMEVSPKNPFIWVNAEQGTKLIENLKRYVRSAERKAGKAAQSG